MNTPKIFSILVGILLIIGGIVFLFQTDSTIMVFILGVVLIFSSVTSLVNYFSIRGGRRNVWTLISAILSLIAGILLISNHFARFFADYVILYAIAIGIIVRGILQVAEALTMKNIVGRMGMSTSALLVIGILMIVAGIIFVITPDFLRGVINTVVSLILIMGGASILAGGLSMP